MTKQSIQAEKFYQKLQKKFSRKINLDRSRIFLALKAQFKNFKHKDHQYSFTRTENQILKILDLAQKNFNSIILYTIVDIKLAKFLETEAKKKNIPCFGALGDLILNFSKLLHQRATHIPSGQHILNEEYYE